MWLVELYDDVRTQVRGASVRELVVTSAASLGLAAPLLAGGWWLVLTATLAARHAIENPASRTAGDTGAMALYWGAAGWMLVGIGMLFVAIAAVMIAGTLRRVLRL